MTQRNRGTGTFAVALAAAAAAACALCAVSPSRAEEPAHLTLSNSVAAGTNGQPLVYSSPRSDLGFTALPYDLRLGGHVEGGYSYNLDPQKAFLFNATEPVKHSVNLTHLFDEKSEDPRFDQLDLFLARDVEGYWDEWNWGLKIEGMWGDNAKFIHSNGLLDNYQIVRTFATKPKKSGTKGERDPATGKILRDPNTHKIILAPKPVRDPMTHKIVDVYARPFHAFDPNGGPDEQFDLTQAYFDLTIPVGNGMRLRAGKVADVMGIETIDPTTTPFYSRGYLFSFALPFTETGAWLAYALNPQWQVEGGVFRGWNQSLEDNNNAVSFHGGVRFTSEDRRAAVQAIVQSGPEFADNSRDYRTVGDITAVLVLGESGAIVGAEGLYGTQPSHTGHGDDEFWGFGGWFVTPLNRYLDLMARIDYLKNNDFALAVPTHSIYEVTVGAGIHPFPNNRYGKGLTIRPELRWDLAAEEIFRSGFTPASAQAPASLDSQRFQWTGAIDLIYAF